MRAVAIGLLGLCGVAVAALLAFYLTMEGPKGRTATPSKDPRVILLAGGVDAVILMPFVTGDVPRLVTGARLESVRAQLWYEDPDTFSGLIAGLVFATMGLPPVTDIATGFQGGVPIRSHSCMTIDCQGWTNAATAPWGMASLRGLGAALGPEVQKEHQSFTDHAAYLAAHQVVVADPVQWFAQPGAEVPVPGDDGIRLVVVSLPSRLIPGVPGDGMTEDPVQAQVLADLAARLLEGTGGTVQASYGAAPTTLWVLRDGAHLYDDNGSRALPDLVLFQPTLRLLVPLANVATVSAHAQALQLPPPDRQALQEAIARAFVSWGEASGCLPECGGIASELQDKTEVNTSGAPFWTLDSWRIPPTALAE